LLHEIREIGCYSAENSDQSRNHHAHRRVPAGFIINDIGSQIRESLSFFFIPELTDYPGEGPEINIISESIPRAHVKCLFCVGDRKSATRDQRRTFQRYADTFY
jgi:hypothetical protein